MFTGKQIDTIVDMKKQGCGCHKIADALLAEFPDGSVTRVAMISRVKRFCDGKDFTTYSNDTNKSVEYKSDGTTTFESIIELADGEPITPEIIMKAHNLDINYWDVISYKNNYYSQQAQGGKLIVLYQSKIVVKPKKFDDIPLQVVEEHFKNLCKTYKPNVCRETVVNQGSNLMLEINIADLHLGKLSWNGETGENYDHTIARKSFFKVIDAEIERVRQNKFEKILFVWTNDFFNSDGMSNSTTAGTPQDVDLRWQKLFLEGCSMLVEAIDMLSKYAPVETFYIASNHSRQVDFYALNYLYAWFRTYDNVTINVNCTPRYYYRYGVNLIGFAHSYYEKKQNLPHLMSIECAKDWSETTYREYHLAHYHSEKVEEKGGVIFRWLPSVTGTDSWHNDCGYVGSVKRSYSFVYDKNVGLISINCVII